MNLARPRQHLRLVTSPEKDPLVEAARERARFWACRQTYSSATLRSIILALIKLIDGRGYAAYRRRSLAEAALCSKATFDRYMNDASAMGLVYRAGQSRKGQRGFAHPAVVLLFDGISRNFAASLGWVDPSLSQPENQLRCTQNEPHKTARKRAQNEPHKAAQNEPHKLRKKNLKPISCEARKSSSRADLNNIDIYKQTFEKISQTDRLKTDPDGDVINPDDATFEMFEAAWLWRPGEPLEPARRAFNSKKLSPADRLLAIRGVHAFAAANRNRKSGLGTAHAYLRDRKWEIAKAAKPLINGGKLLVREGTPAFDAWLAHHRAKTGQRTMFTCNQLDPETGKLVPGILRETLWPPGYAPVEPNRSIAGAEAGTEALLSRDAPNKALPELPLVPPLAAERKMTMIANDNKKITTLLGPRIARDIDLAARTAHAIATGRRTLIRPEEITSAMRRDFELLDLMAARNPPASSDRADQFDPSATALVDVLERDASSGDDGND